MHIVEQIETPYNHVDVWQTDTGYDFEVSGGTHATYDRTRLLTGYAWDAITAAATLGSSKHPNSLLMLGLGGGTALRQLRHFFPDCSFTSVEIDPVMVDLATRYMNLETIHTEVVIDDAYAYIKKTENTYDIIIDDVYLGIASGVVRPISYTYELIESLVHKLTPHGILVTNVISDKGYKRVHRSVEQAYCQIFDESMAVTPPFGFNDSFVGGHSLSSPTTLHERGYSFQHPLDIREWEKLTVRRIKGG